MDALSNYITGIGYDCEGNHGERYKRFWPADLHLIGKDIVRFHTIYWPIFLMALGEPLPLQVFGHPWLLMSGGKISKSTGNIIDADELTEVFGVDAVRYFVLREMPYDNDGTISWDLVYERYNSDLANILGNLVNRTVVMSNKYFGGLVTAPATPSPEDEELRAEASDLFDRVSKNISELRIAEALNTIFTLFKRCNKYIDETEPWVLAKDEGKKERLNAVLFNLLEAISLGATALWPFMPETAEKIAGQVGMPLRDFAEAKNFGLYQKEIKVTEKPEILFARLETPL
jgi:methionyl-tRNA synthetase